MSIAKVPNDKNIFFPSLFIFYKLFFLQFRAVVEHTLGQFRQAIADYGVVIARKTER
jgi:hypothetical protein